MTRVWRWGPVVVAVSVLGACTSPAYPPRPAPSSTAPAPQTGVAPAIPRPSAGSPQASGASPQASGSSPRPPASAARWQPARGLTWQWQLTGTVDTSLPVQVYDVDAVTTPASTVAVLHAAGKHVICYVNVGAKETFRGDAASFPPAVVGGGLEGWPGENWLDIRQWDALRPIMTARLQSCRAKGFDGVEPDNVDGYANHSGFPLTAADQLAYNRHIADLAHSLGLAAGLKNDVEQAATLQPAFDFAVNEECAHYDECDRLKPFVAAGKPVFHVEYDLATSAFCATTKALGFSSMRKKVSLDAWREAC